MGSIWAKGRQLWREQATRSDLKVKHVHTLKKVLGLFTVTTFHRTINSLVKSTLYCFAKCTHVHCVSVYCITCKRFIRSIYKSVERSLDCCQNKQVLLSVFRLVPGGSEHWKHQQQLWPHWRHISHVNLLAAQLLFKNIMKRKWLAQPSASYILASTRLYTYKYTLHYSKRGKSLVLVLLWLSFWNKMTYIPSVR